MDVTAPGSQIYSTFATNNGYGVLSGTSMASPHVAGVAALIASVHPGWQAAQIRDVLTSTATPLACRDRQLVPGVICAGSPELNTYFGHGMANPLGAVSLITPSTVARCLGGKVAIAVTAKNTADTAAELTISTVYGTKTATIAAHKNASVSFTTGAASVNDEVIVTVKSTSTTANDEVLTQTQHVSPTTLSCG